MQLTLEEFVKQAQNRNKKLERAVNHQEGSGPGILSSL